MRMALGWTLLDVGRAGSTFNFLASRIRHHPYNCGVWLSLDGGPAPIAPENQGGQEEASRESSDLSRNGIIF
jgi:hypothetical protein